MANLIITNDIIAKELAMALENEMTLSATVNQQHTSEFKGVGDTIRVQMPNYAAVVTGAALGAVADVVEGSRNLVLDQQAHVNYIFTQKELTLSIDDFANKYAKPAARKLMNTIETSIAQEYKGMFNMVGTAGTAISTVSDAYDVSDSATEQGVPVNTGDFTMHYAPRIMSALATDLKDVNPGDIASTAIEKALVKILGNMTLWNCVNLPVHTAGKYTLEGLIAGASQEVTYTSAVANSNEQVLVTDTWTSGGTDLKEGDTFTIANVFSVNRENGQSTGQLQNFVVKADISDTVGGITMTISPAIIVGGANATVDSSPADGAALTMTSGLSETKYIQHLGFHKDAITLAVARYDDKLITTAGANSKTETTENGMSVTVTQQFNVETFKTTWRFDVLYGTLLQNDWYGFRQIGAAL